MKWPQTIHSAYNFLIYMKMNFYITLLFVSASIYAQEERCIPVSIFRDIYSYSEFTLAYDEAHEQPAWVAYVLDAGEVKNVERCDCFAEDTRIRTGSAETADYKGSGFDRGHISPSADNTGDLSNRESFLLSNMSPQLPAFNRGIWKDLESHVRSQAKEKGKVYVVAGPIFSCGNFALGKNKVGIPDYFFKCLACEENGKIVSIGFLIPHFNAVGSIADYAVSVDAIETMTGFDIFPCFEKSIEYNFSLKNWGF